MFFSKFSSPALGPMQFPIQRVCGTFSLSKLTDTGSYALVLSSRIRGTVFPFPHAGIQLRVEPKRKTTRSGAK